MVRAEQRGSPPGKRTARTRRVAYASLVSLGMLMLVEGVGRLVLPEPIPDVRGDTRGNRLPYDPDVRVVAEGHEGARRLDGGGTFQAQGWTVPASNFRIALVGDSTIHGPFATFFDRGLTMPHDTLNFGVYALASDRVRILAGVALQQDLDLLIVYVGHNEYLEARLNPRSLWSFEGRRRLAWVTRGGVARVLGELLPAPVGASAPADVDPREYGVVGPEEAAVVEASYATNLRAMCDDARAAGVAVAFVAPVSSLVRPPEHRPGGPGYTQDAMLAKARAQLGAEPGRELYLDSRQASLDAASLAYLDGLRALAAGDRARAIEALRAARRADAHPWRVAEPLMAVARRVAEGCGGVFVAPEADFIADPRYLDLADPLFVDQVHPSNAGSRVLAAALVSRLRGVLPAGATWQDPGEVAVEPALQRDAQRGFRLGR